MTHHYQWRWLWAKEGTSVDVAASDGMVKGGRGVEKEQKFNNVALEEILYYFMGRYSLANPDPDETQVAMYRPDEDCGGLAFGGGGVYMATGDDWLRKEGCGDFHKALNGCGGAWAWDTKRSVLVVGVGGRGGGWRCGGCDLGGGVVVGSGCGGVGFDAGAGGGVGVGVGFGEGGFWDGVRVMCWGVVGGWWGVLRGGWGGSVAGLGVGGAVVDLWVMCVGGSGGGVGLGWSEGLVVVGGGSCLWIGRGGVMFLWGLRGGWGGGGGRRGCGLMWCWGGWEGGGCEGGRGVVGWGSGGWNGSWLWCSGVWSLCVRGGGVGGGGVCGVGVGVFWVGGGGVCVVSVGVGGGLGGCVWIAGVRGVLVVGCVGGGGCVGQVVWRWVICCGSELVVVLGLVVRWSSASRCKCEGCESRVGWCCVGYVVAEMVLVVVGLVGDGSGVAWCGALGVVGGCCVSWVCGWVWWAVVGGLWLLLSVGLACELVGGRGGGWVRGGVGVWALLRCLDWWVVGGVGSGRCVVYGLVVGCGVVRGLLAKVGTGWLCVGGGLWSVVCCGALGVACGGGGGGVGGSCGGVIGGGWDGRDDDGVGFAWGLWGVIVDVEARGGAVVGLGVVVCVGVWGAGVAWGVWGCVGVECGGDVSGVSGGRCEGAVWGAGIGWLEGVVVRMCGWDGVVNRWVRGSCAVIGLGVGGVGCVEGDGGGERLGCGVGVGCVGGCWWGLFGLGGGGVYVVDGECWACEGVGCWVVEIGCVVGWMIEVIGRMGALRNDDGWGGVDSVLGGVVGVAAVVGGVLMWVWGGVGSGGVGLVVIGVWGKVGSGVVSGRDVWLGVVRLSLVVGLGEVGGCWWGVLVVGWGTVWIGGCGLFGGGLVVRNRFWVSNGMVCRQCGGVGWCWGVADWVWEWGDVVGCGWLRVWGGEGVVGGAVGCAGGVGIGVLGVGCWGWVVLGCVGVEAVGVGAEVGWWGCVEGIGVVGVWIGGGGGGGVGFGVEVEWWVGGWWFFCWGKWAGGLGGGVWGVVVSGWGVGWCGQDGILLVRGGRGGGVLWWVWGVCVVVVGSVVEVAGWIVGAGVGTVVWWWVGGMRGLGGWVAWGWMGLGWFGGERVVVVVIGLGEWGVGMGVWGLVIGAVVLGWIAVVLVRWWSGFGLVLVWGVGEGSDSGGVWVVAGGRGWGGVGRGVRGDGWELCAGAVDDACGGGGRLWGWCGEREEILEGGGVGVGVGLVVGGVGGYCVVMWVWGVGGGCVCGVVVGDVGCEGLVGGALGGGADGGMVVLGVDGELWGGVVAGGVCREVWLSCSASGVGDVGVVGEWRVVWGGVSRWFCLRGRGVVGGSFVESVVVVVVGGGGVWGVWFDRGCGEGGVGDVGEGWCGRCGWCWGVGDVWVCEYVVVGFVLEGVVRVGGMVVGRLGLLGIVGGVWWGSESGGGGWGVRVGLGLGVGALVGCIVVGVGDVGWLGLLRCVVRGWSVVGVLGVLSGSVGWCKGFAGLGWLEVCFVCLVWGWVSFVGFWVVVVGGVGGVVCGVVKEVEGGRFGVWWGVVWVVGLVVGVVWGWVVVCGVVWFGCCLWDVVCWALGLLGWVGRGGCCVGGGKLGGWCGRVGVWAGVCGFVGEGVFDLEVVWEWCGGGCWVWGCGWLFVELGGGGVCGGGLVGWGGGCVVGCWLVCEAACGGRWVVESVVLWVVVCGGLVVDLTGVGRGGVVLGVLVDGGGVVGWFVVVIFGGGGVWCGWLCVEGLVVVWYGVVVGNSGIGRLGGEGKGVGGWVGGVGSFVCVGGVVAWVGLGGGAGGSGGVRWVGDGGCMCVVGWGRVGGLELDVVVWPKSGFGGVGLVGCGSVVGLFVVGGCGGGGWLLMLCEVGGCGWVVVCGSVVVEGEVVGSWEGGVVWVDGGLFGGCIITIGGGWWVFGGVEWGGVGMCCFGGGAWVVGVGWGRVGTVVCGGLLVCVVGGGVEWSCVSFAFCVDGWVGGVVGWVRGLVRGGVFGMLVGWFGGGVGGCGGLCCWAGVSIVGELAGRMVGVGAGDCYLVQWSLRTFGLPINSSNCAETDHTCECHNKRVDIGYSDLLRSGCAVFNCITYEFRVFGSMSMGDWRGKDNEKSRRRIHIFKILILVGSERSSWRLPGSGQIGVVRWPFVTILLVGPQKSWLGFGIVMVHHGRVQISFIKFGMLCAYADGLDPDV
ncbi:hypothetical protein Tco_1153563 [Tanacetum coccineum]